MYIIVILVILVILNFGLHIRLSGLRRTKFDIVLQILGNIVLIIAFIVKYYK